MAPLRQIFTGSILCALAALLIGATTADRNSVTERLDLIKGWNDFVDPPK